MTYPRTPIEQLAESMRPMFEHSVDELDVSVALESDGINDLAASGYGARDVADLAGQLTDRVPARVHAADEPKPTESIAYLRLACRGLLFAVPGLFYLVIARSDRTAAGGYTLLASMLAGWGISQAVAVVAYRLLGRAGRRSAAVALRRWLIRAAVLGVIAILIGAYFGAPLLVTTAVGQILYVIAATVLLFHGADLLLALSLVPGAALSIAFLADDGASGSVALAGVAVTVGVAMASAWYTAYAAARGEGPTDSARYGDVVASIPFMANGVLTGAVVAYLPIRLLGGYDASGGHAVDVSIIPLVLSMGFAEIELLRLQAATRRLMRRCTQVSDYRRGSVVLVARAQGGFLLALAVISLAVAGVMTMTSRFTARDLTLFTAYSTLGAALLAGLVLVSVDRVHVVLNGFALSGGIIGLGYLAARFAGITLTTEAGYLAGCLVLLICMTMLTLRTLRNPVVMA